MGVNLGRTKRPMSAAQKAALRKAIEASARARRGTGKPDAPSTPRKKAVASEIRAAGDKSRRGRVRVTTAFTGDLTKRGNPRRSAADRAAGVRRGAGSKDPVGETLKSRIELRKKSIAKDTAARKERAKAANANRQAELAKKAGMTVAEYKKKLANDSRKMTNTMKEQNQGNSFKRRPSNLSQTPGGSKASERPVGQRPDPGTMGVSQILKERKELIAKRNSEGLSKEEAARLVAVQAESALRHQNRKKGLGTGPTKVALGEKKADPGNISQRPDNPDQKDVKKLTDKELEDRLNKLDDLDKKMNDRRRKYLDDPDELAYIRKRKERIQEQWDEASMELKSRKDAAKTKQKPLSEMDMVELGKMAKDPNTLPAVKDMIAKELAARAKATTKATNDSGSTKKKLASSVQVGDTIRRADGDREVVAVERKPDGSYRFTTRMKGNPGTGEFNADRNEQLDIIDSSTRQNDANSKRLAEAVKAKDSGGAPTQAESDKKLEQRFNANLTALQKIADRLMRRDIFDRDRDPSQPDGIPLGVDPKTWTKKDAIESALEGLWYYIQEDRDYGDPSADKIAKDLWEIEKEVRGLTPKEIRTVDNKTLNTYAKLGTSPEIRKLAQDEIDRRSRLSRK